MYNTKKKQDYKIMDARRIKQCPKCRRCKTGDVCMCGYEWKDKKKYVQEKKKNKGGIPKCRLCNQLGTHSGLCEMHWEKQSEKIHIKRLNDYRNGTNDKEIDNMISLIKYKKLAHPVGAPKQEETQYEKIGDNGIRQDGQLIDRIEIPF